MRLLSLGTFHSDEEVEVDVRERLRMREPDFDLDGMFKLLPILGSKMLGDNFDT
jgi:hypothetical protein